MNLAFLQGHVGEIAVAGGALTEANRNVALTAQARAQAIFQSLSAAGQPIPGDLFSSQNIAKLATDAEWQEMRVTHRVTDEQIAEATTHIQSGRGASEGVPPIGQIATALGLITQGQINVLLEVQAYAKASGFLASAFGGGEIGDRPADPRPSDPPFLQEAQAAAIQAYNIARLEDEVERGRAVAQVEPRIRDALLNAPKLLRDAGMPELAARVWPEVNRVRTSFPSYPETNVPPDEYGRLTPSAPGGLGAEIMRQ